MKKSCKKVQTIFLKNFYHNTKEFTLLVFFDIPLSKHFPNNKNFKRNNIPELLTVFLK